MGVVDAGNYSMNQKDVIYGRNKGKKAALTRHSVFPSYSYRMESQALWVKQTAVVDAGSYSTNKKDVIYGRNKGKKAGLTRYSVIPSDSYRIKSRAK